MLNHPFCLLSHYDLLPFPIRCQACLMSISLIQLLGWVQNRAQYFNSLHTILWGRCFIIPTGHATFVFLLGRLKLNLILLLD